jgi:DNA-binding CsgD family transcriptional regulator
MKETRSRNISRGEFLKVAGILTTAGVIVACNLQTATTQSPPDASREQRLQSEFNLSPMNAKTFALFIDNRNNHLGRRKIAGQLNISLNTLKDHISRIIRHVRSQGNSGVSTLNDAVNVAANI